MSEIRLAVCHPDSAAFAGIAARLRGASVEPYSADCTAAMLCGAGPSPEELLRAGVHVLFVAEPCPSALALEVLFREAQRAGVKLAVVNPDRYSPSRQLICKQLGGPLGEAGLVRLHRWQPAGTVPEVAGLPEPLIRDLDSTLWLAGQKPNRVFAIEQKEGAGWFVQVHLGFPHGGMALLDFDSRLPAGDGYQSLSVIAASGAAYADDHQNTQLLYRGGNALAIRTEERAGQFAEMAQEFVNALKEGGDWVANDWKLVFAIADAAGKSLASGKAVALEAN
jgi:predicted dehydrogenase